MAKASQLLRAVSRLTREIQAVGFASVPFSSPKLPTMQQRTTETYMARRNRLHELFQAVHVADATSCLATGKSAARELRTLHSTEGFAVLDETVFFTLQNLIRTKQLFRAAKVLTQIIREGRFPLPPSLLDVELPAYLKLILERLPQAGCNDPGIGRNAPTKDELVTVDDEDPDGSRFALRPESFPLLDGTARSMTCRLFVPACNILEHVVPQAQERKASSSSGTGEGEEDGSVTTNTEEGGGEQSMCEKLLMFADPKEQASALRQLLHEDYSGSTAVVQIFSSLLLAFVTVAAETGDVVVLQGLAVIYLNLFVKCDGDGELLSDLWGATSTAASNNNNNTQEALRSFSDEFISSFYYGLYFSTRRGVPGGGDAAVPICFASPRQRYEVHCGTETQKFLDKRLTLVMNKNKLASATHFWQFCTASPAPLWLDSSSAYVTPFSAEEVELLSARSNLLSPGGVVDAALPPLRRALAAAAKSHSTDQEGVTGDLTFSSDVIANVVNHCLDLCSYASADREGENSSPLSQLSTVALQLRSILEELPVDVQMCLTAEQCATICIALRPPIVAASSSVGCQLSGLQTDSLLWVLQRALVPSLCSPSVAGKAIGNVFGSAMDLLLMCDLFDDAKRVFVALSDHNNIFSSTVPPAAFKRLFDKARDCGDVEFCLLLRQKRQDLF